MNKSIAFIYLPHPWLKEPDAQLPLGILYLAAVTRNAGYETTVLNYSGSGFEDALLELQGLNEFDFYAITATSLEIPMANDFGKAIKAMFPNCKLLIGGPGTCTPEYIDRCFDLVYIGEAENEIVEFLEYYSNPLQSSKIVHSNSVGPQDLDKLPLPARDFVTGSLGGKIFAFGKEYVGSGSTTIISSRGCPFACSFCASQHSSVRFRDPTFVVDEMKFLYLQYGIRQFRFSDDAFTLNRERVMSICRLLRHSFKDGDIAWRVSCRVKPIDHEMVSAMVQAGCKEFSFGIESFDQNVLDCLCKGTTVKDNIQALKVVNDCGGNSRLLFMIRTPGQDLFTVDRNIEILEKVPYEIIACTTFVPLPGSAIWEQPDKFGIRILSRDLSEYNFYFFNKDGRQQLKKLFEYTNRSKNWSDHIDAESERFRTYLEGTGKLNKG